MKKIASKFLALSLAFGMFLALPGNASAAGTGTQDGLEAAVTTNKTEYTADEDILVSVNIKNNNSYKVEDVSVETLLPEGLVLKTGTLSAADIDIEAGASYSDSVVAQLSEDLKDKKETTPADTTKPEDTSKPGGNGQDTNSPQTDDNSSIVLWAVLLIASAVGIILASKSKKTMKIMSLLLCIAAVLAMLPMSVFTAANVMEITVDKTITVDGKKYTIVSKVKKPVSNVSETPSTENFGSASNTKPEDYSTTPVPFKTEIDAFNRQVKEYPREDFDPVSAYDYFTGDKGISLRKLEIDGIHFYEAKPTGSEPVPLVILLHGGGWHKDFEWAAWTSVTSGLCVVSIDDAAHGESQAGPLQGPAVWMETVKYIDTLIEYYNTRPDVDAAKFGLNGFSLGGITTEYYVLYGKYKPAAVCIECAGADLTGTFPASAVHNKGGGAPEYSVWTVEQTSAFTSATAPLKFPEYFKDIPMFICVGALDDTYSNNTMEEFKDKIEALGNDQIVYHYFEDKGHEVPDSWEENERIQFFEMIWEKHRESQP